MVPVVVADDEVVETWFAIDAVVDASQVVIEPAQLQLAAVDAGFRSEVAGDVIDALVGAGADDERMNGWFGTAERALV